METRTHHTPFFYLLALLIGFLVHTLIFILQSPDGGGLGGFATLLFTGMAGSALLIVKIVHSLLAKKKDTRLEKEFFSWVFILLSVAHLIASYLLFSNYVLGATPRVMLLNTLKILLPLLFVPLNLVLLYSRKYAPFSFALLLGLSWVGTFLNIGNMFYLQYLFYPVLIFSPGIVKYAYARIRSNTFIHWLLAVPAILILSKMLLSLESGIAFFLSAKGIVMLFYLAQISYLSYLYSNSSVE